MKIVFIIVGVLLLLAALWFFLSLCYFMYLSLPYDEWAKIEDMRPPRKRKKR